MVVSVRMGSPVPATSCHQAIEMCSVFSGIPGVLQCFSTSCSCPMPCVSVKLVYSALPYSDGQ